MLAHAPTPEIEAVPHRPVTYGDLVDATSGAVRAALLLPRNQELAPDSAHAELLGHQRFLRVCGIHLGLLAQFHPAPTPALRQLAEELTAGAPPEARFGGWLTAAQSLGAAHDLLATHLDRAGLPCTVEAEETVTPVAVLAATHSITGLILDALPAGPDLARAAANTHGSNRSDLAPVAELPRLRSRTVSLRTLAEAVQTDAGRPMPDNSAGPLSALEPAPLLSTSQPSPRSIPSELGALRTLRQLTFTQGQGHVAASPTSLRDLALMGSTFTQPELSWLPSPSTALQRLARAHARDNLETAHAAWSRAAGDLTETILGITRAPRLYGDAIDLVRTSDQLSPGVRLAFLSALPRLGVDAAHAVDRLHAQNALVAKKREGTHLQMTWRPISAAEARDLADRFRNAATSSEVAAATVRQILSPPKRAARPGAEHLASRTRRELELSRSAQR